MITGRPRVYFDSNLFIAAFENVGAHSDHAWWIIHAIQDGDICGSTSEITLAELLIKPIEFGMKDLAASYETMIVSGPNFEVLPISRDILVGAAKIRAQRRSTRLPDAVHIASAQASACAYFVSEDRRIAVPEEMRLLPVSPFTLDDILGGARER